MGTDSDNTFTIKKGGAIIEASSGSDTYKFKGKLESGTTVISTELDLINNEKDKFIFEKYSFEDHTLGFGTYNNNLDNGVFLTTIDFNKKSKYVGEHNILYNLYIDENGNKLQTQPIATIQDSKRTYDFLVYQSLNQLAIDWRTQNTNHFANILSDKDITLYSNSGYNQIYMNKINSEDTSFVNHTYTNTGGHDFIQSTSIYANDTYTIDFNKDSYLSICDYGGNDILHIDGTTTTHARLFMYVEKTGTNKYIYSNNKYIFTDETKMNKDNIYVKDGIAYTKSGVSVDGDIETTYMGYIQNGKVNMDEWLSTIAQNVGVWLCNSGMNKWGFKDSYQVLESGNKTAINSLMSVYSNVKGSFYIH